MILRSGSVIKLYWNLRKQSNIIECSVMHYILFWFEENEKINLFKLKDNKTIIKEVLIGAQNLNFVEILEGLDEDDIVVTETPHLLGNGKSIKPVFLFKKIFLSSLKYLYLMYYIVVFFYNPCKICKNFIISE